MSTTQQKAPTRASNARIVIRDDMPNNHDTAKSIPQTEREAGIAGTKKAQAATAYA